MQILTQRFIFKEHYGHGFRTVMLQEHAGMYFVHVLWSSFFTNRLFKPYKAVYTGKDLEAAKMVFEKFSNWEEDAWQTTG